MRRQRESKTAGQGDSQAEQRHSGGLGALLLLLLLFIYFKTKLTEMFALNIPMKQDIHCLKPENSQPGVCPAARVTAPGTGGTAGRACRVLFWTRQIRDHARAL